MTLKEAKILVNTAIESEDPKQVKNIIEKLDSLEVGLPGALEAIYSGISTKMSQLLENA